MQDRNVKIIVEGTDFANTKNIALALSEHPPLVSQSGYFPYTTVISAKWGNFRDFPWGKGLIDFDPIAENQAMKNYAIWVRLIELQGNYNWIIDRFHISTQRYQLQCNHNLCDFNWLEERLLKLGFHLVHIAQNEEALRRAIKRQKTINAEGDVETILQEQELLRKIVSKSKLPTLALDISEMSVQETIGNITDWFQKVNSNTHPENQQQEKIFLPSCC